MRPEDHYEVVALHARLCQALADPKRLLLIYALADGPRTVGELCAELDLPQANVSQHLAILRDRGIVTASRSGSNVLYRLRGHQVVQALDLLRDYMREVMSTAG
ncbi:MAG: ArsR/SmtB family transcription factor [Acidimicrobiales bacterium]